MRGGLLAVALLLDAARAWSAGDVALHRASSAAPRVRAAPCACICINCKWVDRCATYHWVEKQHEQPHVTAAPDFHPDDPQGAFIVASPHAQTSTTAFRGSRPLRCRRACAVQVFIRSEGEAAAAMSNAPDEGAEVARGMITAVLTTEYDVFECASFSEDVGKWVRLMPDAGFVPT